MDVQNLINELAEKEITLWCEGANLKYKAPKGAMTADLLSKIKSGKSEIIDFLNEHGNLQFVRNTKGRYEKFPLTDIQNSYVVGRNTMYELGGVACHGYIEMSFDKVLDIKQLEIAWNKVIQKHDMLRAIVSNSGYQIVQEAVPYVTIQCLDLRITEGNNETDKNDFRRRLANKQYELGKWPMCDLALTVENEKSIIHLSLDMLIADFVSTNIILHNMQGLGGFSNVYECADEIITSIRNHRIEELDCIYGISLGASIAIEIALRDCIRINKLILDGGQFESMGIMKKIDAYFMAKEFQKVIQKKRMWSYVSKQMGYRNGNEIEVLYPLCCKRIQFDTLYDAALAAYGYDIKKRMEKLRMKVVIMYGGNELFAAKSVSLVKEKCVSEFEVYAYDNMGHSEVLSLYPEKLCEIIRK